MVLDGCAVHTSATVRAALKGKHPMLTLCFTDPNTTDICQPLDIAIKQRLKARLKGDCARSRAYDVLQKVLEGRA